MAEKLANCWARRAHRSTRLVPWFAGKLRWAVLGSAATSAASGPAFGLVAREDPRTAVENLADLSLEELIQVEVSLVSRVPERRVDAPAVVFVLSREDIRRRGASSLPELLRYVPGVHVARTDANTWAVSARGFNGQYSRKLLVLVDGRNVYSPPFSGVYWDMKDVPVESIERIDAMRGPGGRLWGANAVNGIINIVARSAWQTEGARRLLSGGVAERNLATLSPALRRRVRARDDSAGALQRVVRHDRRVEVALLWRVASDWPTQTRSPRLLTHRHPTRLAAAPEGRGLAGDARPGPGGKPSGVCRRASGTLAMDVASQLYSTVTVQW